MLNSRLVPAALVCAFVAAAGPALAQQPASPAAAAAAVKIEPCPEPAKLPPANSPPLLRCMQLIAHPVNELLVDPQTYDYYIRTPRPDSANDKWVPFNEESILTDFNTLWNTNFLDNLWIEVIDEPYANGIDGKHVVFHLEERNRVKAVDYAPINGGKLRVPISKIDDALKERNITVTLDTFIDESTIRKVVGVIRELYAQEGYNDAKVEATTREVAGGPKLVDLRFNIDDGPKIQLRDIVFDGNTAFSDKTLRRHMKQNRKRSRFLLLIPGGGAYREEKFAEDAEQLADFYKDNGYAMAQIGAPQLDNLEVTKDGKTRWVRMRVPVDEGQKYTIGKFEVTDATALKTEPLRAVFQINEGDDYSLKKIRKGFEKVKEVYGAYGYYQWAPDTSLVPRGIDMATGKPIGPEPPPPIIDVTVKMNEGKQFFVNRITFVGNTTTHDAVIRRELRLAEGSVFNSEALKNSVRRLNQLGYFKPLQGKEGDMDVTPTPDEDNKVDVKLKVQEQNRNSIAFGAGVSQFEGVFGQLSFQTSNFLGRGETVGISLQKGSRARQYQLSFSEPYLFDRNVTVGVDVHSRQFIYPSTFTQESTGGNTTLGLPLADYTRLFLSYSYERVSVFDVNPAYLTPQVLANNPYLADSLLVGQNGRRQVSKISPNIVFNTVNQPLYPTAGQRYSLGFDFAGLGGNTQYTQASLEGIWYMHVAGRTSLGLRLQGQYIRPYGDTRSLPIFEKIFLGGEYTVRGFDIRTVSPRDPLSGVVVGGNKSIVGNIEYYIDIGQLRLVAFYDAGEVRDIGQSFVAKEDVSVIVAPALPLLTNLTDQHNLLTLPGAIHTEVIGKTSAIKTSTGLEARFLVPVLNIPFRLISSFNPQRLGVINNNVEQTPRFTFRFAVGTTF